MTIERVRAGFGVTFHVIGDRGFEMALNAFEAAANDMKQRHTPMEKLPDFHSFRVEHAQVTNPELLKRAAELELIMSMQPCHLLSEDLGVAAILSDCGLEFADVAKTTVFVTNLGEFAAINAIYTEAFGDHKPARSTVQVAALPGGATVEIEVWALRP